MRCEINRRGDTYGVTSATSKLWNFPDSRLGIASTLSMLPWEQPSSGQKPQLATQPVSIRREPLTVMVFSLLCFFPGDEDPRFWGERQETSSKLFSILDILFSFGFPEVVELVKIRTLVLSLQLTPKSPYSGRGQAGVPLTPCCSHARLRENWGKPPAQALRELLQTSPPLLPGCDLGADPSAALCW